MVTLEHAIQFEYRLTNIFWVPRSKLGGTPVGYFNPILAINDGDGDGNGDDDDDDYDDDVDDDDDDDDYDNDGDDDDDEE